MATYAHDLTTITTAESGTWGEITGYVGGGAPAADTDYFIQGTGCYTQSEGGKTGLQVSMYFNYGSDLSASITSGKCVFFWQVVLAGNGMDTFANGGLRLGIGSSAADFKQWISGGNNFGRNPYGGWQNIAIDPTYTPVDYTLGTPTTAMQYFCSHPNLVAAISKGNLHGMDAIRYGRGQLTATSTACTFTGLGTFNDYNDATNGYNRLGLFQAISGGYLWKGLLSLGTSGASCTFSDSNINITIDNTPRTNATFNTININNASSSITWTNINFAALSATQLSKGDFAMIDNATVVFTSCSFTDMNTFTFNTNATVTSTTFRRCAAITAGGGTFTSSIVDASTVAADAAAFVWNVATDTSGKLNNMTFTKGTNAHHAIQLGTSSPTSVTFSNITFTGFHASNGQNDSAILVSRTSGDVTINITNGGAAPTYKTAGATVYIVTSVSITVTILNSAGAFIPGVEVAIFQDNAARTVVLASTTTNNLGVVSTSAASGLGAIIIRARQSTSSTTFLTSQAFTSELLTTVEATHNFSTGDAVVYSKDGGSAAIGLTDTTTYYVLEDTANTLYLYDTAANAIAAGPTGLMNLTTDGAETHILDPIRYVPASATGTVGTTAFSAQITMITDDIATG